MLYEAEKGDFTIALAGDCMLTRKLSVFKEERFLSLAETLRSADAAFANLEGTVHSWDEGTPGITQGTFMTTDPKLLEDLKWFGINLVSCANNHAFDYGEGGVLANLRHLDEAGLAHEMGKERNRKHFYSSKEIPDDKAAELVLLGNRYVLDKAFSISTQANQRDREDNVRWIREARRQADWVVVSVHCHEFGGKSLLTARSRGDLEETADFVTTFAHQAIDTGADIFVGHGSHFPMGIEIYQGKPIFYSVGNFIFQNETVGFFPADAYERFDLDLKATPSDFLDARTSGGKKGHPSDPAYWENMFAVCKFNQKELKEIKIFPIDQGFGRPRPQRGRPLLAEGEVASRVIDRVTRLSQRYGTKISNRDDIGVIEIPERRV